MPVAALGETVAVAPRRDAAAALPGFGLFAAVLLAIALTVRASIASQGWFYADDLATLGRVHRDSFLDTASYGEGGHIAFVDNAVGWVTWRLFGFGWFAHVAWMLFGFSLVAGLLLWLLVRLFGKRIGVLLCWTVFLLSSALAPSLMWLSQSSIIWALLLPSLAVAHAYVSYAVHGGIRWLAAMAFLLALGLFASERTAILVPQLLVLTTIAMWRRPAFAALRLVPPVVVTLATVLPYVGYYYLTAAGDRSAELDITVQAALEQAGRGFLLVWLPTMAGGPWFLDTEQVLARADLDNPLWPAGLILVAVVVVAGTVASGLRGFLAACTVLAFGVLDVVAVVWARHGSLGDFAVTEWRYYSHSAVPLALALAIMFLPTKQSVPQPGRPAVRATLAAVAVVWCFGALYTAFSMTPRWASNPAREYLGTTLAELRRTPRPHLVDRQLPADVMSPVLTYATRASWVLAGAVPQSSWRAPSIDLLSIDDSGHLGPVTVTGGTRAVKGPVEDCGWRITDRPVRIPLRSPLFDWNWVVELGYLSSGWMSVPMTIDGHPYEVPIARGVGQTQIPFEGPVRAVTLGPLAAGASLCVDRIEVGEPASGPRARS